MEALNLAFIGLGVMGFPMAGHLAKAGHRVKVYNRTRAKAEAWTSQYGGELSLTPAAAATDATIVFACVGDDNDLRAVTMGEDGAFKGMAPGSIFVDHTTGSALLAREAATRAQQQGLQFLDAPVSGGQLGAENGTLTVMVGGDPLAFERVRPIIQLYSRAVTHMGPPGAGQLTKMVNQICAVGVIQSLAEGIDFGLRAGLDMKRVLAVLSKGAATSWQMENRGQTMVEGKFDFGFAVDWMRKDLRICLEEAQRNGSVLEITRLIEGFCGEVQQMGGGRWDTSALINRLRENGRLTGD